MGNAPGATYVLYLFHTFCASIWTTAAVCGLAIVLVLNIRSWPFAWHVRVFRPALILELEHYAIELRYIFSSRKERMKGILRWIDSRSPIGVNPFEHVVKYRARACIDDCDFNLHMSNSSYSKTIDVLLVKTILASFLTFFAAGGWLPVAANYFHYMKEIPMLHPYEVRMSIAAWDGKWVYFVSKFVTKTTQRTTNAKREGNPPASEKQDGQLHVSIPFPSPSPSIISAPPTPAGNAAEEDPEETLRAVAALLSSSDKQEDGTTLHAVAVSRCCFKLGRITVPPSLVIALSGFAGPASTPSQSPPSNSPELTSSAPPHWRHVEDLRSGLWDYQTSKYREFLAGGWRNVPQQQRWWEEALRGVEETRIQGLQYCDQVVRFVGELGNL